MIAEIGFLLVVIQKLIYNLNSLFGVWSSMTGRFVLTRRYINLIKEYKNKKNFHIKERLNWSNISLKDLSFIYPNSDNFALENINFEIKRGENVAITGSSGCGKSTLTEIIMCLIKKKF